jgi:hypothetical protein
VWHVWLTFRTKYIDLEYRTLSLASEIGGSGCVIAAQLLGQVSARGHVALSPQSLSEGMTWTHLPNQSTAGLFNLLALSVLRKVKQPTKSRQSSIHSHRLTSHNCSNAARSGSARGNDRSLRGHNQARTAGDANHNEPTQ